MTYQVMASPKASLRNVMTMNNSSAIPNLDAAETKAQELIDSGLYERVVMFELVLVKVYKATAPDATWWPESHLVNEEIAR